MMDVDALTAHIRAQLHQDPTPAQIAAHFGVNRFALSRWFRAETGLSLRDYIAALKIEQGIAPLVQGQPVIASQLEAGHASAATYAHRFRAHTGQSPQRVRNRRVRARRRARNPVCHLAGHGMQFCTGGK